MNIDLGWEQSSCTWPGIRFRLRMRMAAHYRFVSELLIGFVLSVVIAVAGATVDFVGFQEALCSGSPSVHR